MAAITVCDWRGCGTTLPEHHDRAEVSHELMSSLRGGDMPPRSLYLQLCRPHALEVRAFLERMTVEA